MKKILSTALAITVILSALAGCIMTAFAAADDAIVAMPLTGWTKYSYYTTTEAAQPLGYTTAGGIKMTAYANGGTGSSTVNASKAAAQLQWSDGKALTDFNDIDYLIFYVKTDGANTIMPMIHLSRNTEWGLNVGKSYEYLALNGDAWQTGTVGDKGNPTVNAGAAYATRKAWGTISFDSAFEGYIKVSLKSFCHATTTTGNQIYTATDTMTGFELKAEGLTDTYGNVAFGPVFITDSTSTSATITVPDEYKTDPIEATPLVGWTAQKQSVVSATTVTPLSYTTANGIQIGSVSGDVVDSTKSYVTMSFCTVETGSTPQPTSTARDLDETSTAFLLYVKTDIANTITPKFNIDKWTTASDGTEGYRTRYDLTFIRGLEYQYKTLNADSWTSATANSDGSITFGTAFEGYIKLPYAGFRNANGNMLDQTLDKLWNFTVAFSSLGGEYGGAVVGPLFEVTSDSVSPEIVVPDEYKPQPISATNLTNYVARADLAHNSNYTTFSVETTDGLHRLYSDTAIVAEDGKIGNVNTVCFDYDFGNAAPYGKELCATPQNYSAIVFYVKTIAANMIVPSIVLQKPADTDRWSQSYNPVMSINPGATVSVLRNGASEWETVTTENVSSNEYVFGGIVFEAGFEGYIKVPVTSLYSGTSLTVYNDKGTAQNDKIFAVSVRFKGVGGEYGDVILGQVAYVTDDTGVAEVNAVDPVWETGDIDNNYDVNSNDISLLRKAVLTGSTAGANAECLNISGDTDDVDILDLVCLSAVLNQ